MVAVETNGRSRDHVCVLPKPGASTVESDGRSAVHRHRVGGYMNWAGRGQQRAVGLRLQVTIGALYLALRHGIPGRTIHTHASRGGGHSAFDHAWCAGQNEDLIGGGIARPRSPSFKLTVL